MLANAHITDAPVYLDDKSLLGICEEFNVPELEIGQVEHSTLGSVGTFKLPGRGNLTPTDGSMILLSPDPELITLSSNPRKALRFQLHSKVDAFDAMGLVEEKSTTIVTHVTALFYKRIFPSGKRGEAGKYTGEFSITRLMQRDINSSTPIVEIDFFANIYKVNGEDFWPD
ncbi:phage major tail tube protein [Tateyamaria sp.]|uniref:phage major tail tube protein n=1 Tax=Tateyamaria sp. TaxID=1929288 RepID=UPI003B21BF79